MGRKIEIDIPEAPGDKVIIETDDAGKVINVKDSKGNSAKAEPIGNFSLKIGGKDRKLVSVSEGAIITAHSSPGCVWVSVGGSGYWI